MQRKITLLSFSILMLIIVTRMVITSRVLSFDDLNRTGGIIVESRTDNKVNIDKIKSIINENTKINMKDIDVIQENGILTIKVKHLEHMTEAKIKSIINEYDNSIEFFGFSSIEKSTESEIIYIIYFLILLFFSLNIAFIIKMIMSINQSYKIPINEKSS